MSIHPIKLNNGDTSHTFWHDEMNHGGDVLPSALRFGTKADGSADHTTIAVDCPGGCGSTSYHPIGGGADAPMIQRLFIYHLMTHFTVPAAIQTFLISKGFPGGFAWAPPRSYAQAKALVKLYTIAQDGPDRWQLENVAQGA